MSTKAPDAPDYGPLAQVQEKLGRRQIALQEKTFRYLRSRTDAADRQTRKVVDKFYQEFQEARQRSRAEYRDYERIYRPEARRQFRQDVKREDRAYRQFQEDRRRAIEEFDRQRDIAIEDREYFEDVARPLQERLIREERRRQLEADEDRRGVIDTSSGEQRRLARQAREDRARYEEDYLPYEETFADRLRNFDTAGRREQAAGQAISEVGQAFQAERDAAERRLTSYGIDPSMLRAGAIDNQTRIAEATAAAQAGTEARRYIEEEGTRRGALAVELGRGVNEMSGAASDRSATQGGVAGQAIYGNVASADNLANPGSGGGLITAANALGGGMPTQTPGTAARDALNSTLAFSGQGTGVLPGISGANLGFLSGATQAATAPIGYAGAATDAFQGATNTLNTGYQNQLQQAQFNWQTGPGALLSGIGAIGGLVSAFEEGGAVEPEMSPSRGAIPDDVPARLTEGEYVVDADTVRWHGEKFFHNLKTKAQKERGALPTGT